MYFVLRLFVVGFLMMCIGWLSTPTAQAASCAEGTLSGAIETDTTLSGEQYMDGNLTLRNGAVVTITAGTEITVCGEYLLWVQDATLIAEGTVDAPIRMTPDGAEQTWRGIYMGGGGMTLEPSRLRYVELIRAGKHGDNTDQGALEIYAPRGTNGSGPMLDHVTVRDSATYGIHVRVDDPDATPLSLTNLTVTGSGAAPLMIYASSMIGLGTGHTFSGNAEDVIELRGGTVLGGRIYHSQTWPRQPVPFRLPDGQFLPIGHDDSLPVVTIEAGNIFEMGLNSFVRVVYGGLVLEGNEDAPIIFRRSGNGAWRQILIDDRFSPSMSRMDYVEISGTDNEDGAIDLNRGELSISHADIRNNSAGAGIHVTDGFLRLTDSTLNGNRVGVHFVVGAGGILRNNNLAGNPDGGVENIDSRGSCVDAINNFWGSGVGPTDNSSAEDDCGQATTNSGGTAVSDNVRYVPWKNSLDGSDLADASSITPTPYWAIADGLDTVNLELLVRSADGTPLVGKMIELTTSHGDITQPQAPTDTNGRTFATLRATSEGNALITARNLTDDSALAAIASVYFWQGPGDSGGLIDPQGAPYATPNLIVEGEPFQAGVPLLFRLPMQNTQSTPIAVNVTYGATGFGLGQRFTPVTTVTHTLQPGESWEAPATWAPTVTGHQCVQATLTYTLPNGTLPSDTEQVVVQELMQSGSTTRQKNLNTKPPDDPCSEPDATKLIPTKPGVGGANKHFKNATDQTNKVRKCLDTINFAANFAAQAAGNAQEDRDYTVVATPPVYTPPLLETGPGVSQAQADVANRVGALAAEVAGLQVAIDLTLIRTQWAGQADDFEATRRQLQAYQEYRTQLRAKLLAYADAIDDALAVMHDEDEPDILFSTADYAAYLDDLKANGYDDDTLAYHEASGLSDAEIMAMLDIEIRAFEKQQPPPTTLFALLAENRDAALETARQIPALARTAADGPMLIDEQPAQVAFMVGNPTDARNTVDLFVRPVSLPAGWSYELDNHAPELDPGETTTVTLTLVPGGPLVEGVVPQVAVEGFVGDEFIGGVLVRAGLPMPMTGEAAFLPYLQKE